MSLQHLKVTKGYCSPAEERWLLRSSQGIHKNAEVQDSQVCAPTCHHSRPHSPDLSVRGLALIQRPCVCWHCTALPESLQVDISGGSVVKTLPANAGGVGSIPGSERSLRAGNGNPLQYSCLGNSMEGGAWWATWDRKESDTTEWLSTQAFYLLTLKT